MPPQVTQTGCLPKIRKIAEEYFHRIQLERDTVSKVRLMDRKTVVASAVLLSVRQSDREANRKTGKQAIKQINI